MFTGHGSMLMAGMEGHADATCILAPAGLKVSPRGQGLLASKLHSDSALDRDTDHDDQRQADQARGQPAARALSPSTGQVAPPSGANIISLAAHNAAALDEVRRSATCGLCHALVAASLVLSCGHQFCGGCLFDHLNQKPSCPTCQVGLRAIPVRCLAMDGVVEALGRVLSKQELDAYHARAEEGKSAANKINKMFWWLQPAAIPALGDAQAQNLNMGAGHPQHNNASAAAAVAMAGAPAPSRVRSSSGGGAPPPAPRQTGQQSATLDAHAPAYPQNPAHHQQSHQHMLPGLFEAIGAQQPQQPVVEDCGYNSNRHAGNKPYHRDPQRTPFYNPNAQAARPPVHRNYPGPVPGGIDASHLVAMGLNPPLASRSMVAPPQQQQQHMQQPFYDYTAAPAQVNMPTSFAALQYFTDYASLAAPSMQPQAQAESMAQLQQLLLNSLALGDMYPQHLA